MKFPYRPRLETSPSEASSTRVHEALRQEMEVRMCEVQGIRDSLRQLVRRPLCIYVAALCVHARVCGNGRCSFPLSLSLPLLRNEGGVRVGFCVRFEAVSLCQFAVDSHMGTQLARRPLQGSCQQIKDHPHPQ